MSVGTVTSNSVWALTVYGNVVIAGGCFNTAGGTSAGYVAAWDGSNWGPIWGAMNDCITDLTVIDNTVIAGGDFRIAGGVSATHVATWGPK